MMTRLLVLGALLASTCLVALGADIDGKWTAQFEGRGGTVTQTLMLKADGEKLTGTMDGGRGGPIEISEGMMHGDDVMFKVERDLGDKGKLTQNYKGKMEGGELKMTVETDFGGNTNSREMTFKKAE
jgi:hypothetical protein